MGGVGIIGRATKKKNFIFLPSDIGTMVLGGRKLTFFYRVVPLQSNVLVDIEKELRASLLSISLKNPKFFESTTFLTIFWRD